MRMLLQAVLAAVLVAAAASADEWNKTYNIAGRPELRVETDDGSVTVRPGDGHRVEAHVTTTGYRLAPGEVDLRESQTGDHVDLSVHVPRSLLFHVGISNRSIHVDLRVPRQILADIRTGDGSIDVSGLAGEMRLHTGDGHIDALQLDGSLTADSGDGHVRVQGRFDVMNLHTGDGSVEAEVLPGSRMASSWKVDTGDGSVTLKLPPDLAADLQLHTGDGSIALDVPAVRNVSGRHDKDMQARLNGGGAVFTVRTGDGSIHVRPL